jgi:hypothetical protein
MFPVMVAFATFTVPPVASISGWTGAVEAAGLPLPLLEIVEFWIRRLPVASFQ